MTDALLTTLQHRAGQPVLLLWAPGEVEEAVARWEAEGVTVHRRVQGESPFVLAFVRSCADIERQAARVAALLGGADPVLWMAYPKKSSKRYSSDVGRVDSWQPLGDLGFEPVRQVAIDTEWSALRFRRAERVAKLTGSGAIPPTGKRALATAAARTIERWRRGGLDRGRLLGGVADLRGLDRHRSAERGVE